MRCARQSPPTGSPEDSLLDADRLRRGCAHFRLGDRRGRNRCRRRALTRRRRSQARQVPSLVGIELSLAWNLRRDDASVVAELDHNQA